MSIKIVTGRTGEAHVTREDDQNRNRAIFGYNNCCILANIGNECSCTHETDSNTVTIHSGDVIVDGIHSRIISDTAITIPAGVAGSYRYTYVVVRYQFNQQSGCDSVSLETITTTSGTYSDNSSPISASNIIRDYPIYRIKRYGSTVYEPELLAVKFYAPNQSNLTELYVKNPNGSGYGNVQAYTSDGLGETIGLFACDSDKNTAAGLRIYEKGAMTYSYGNKSFALPFIQFGTTTINTVSNGSVNMGSKTIQFGKEYNAAPLVFYSVNSGGTSANLPLVTISDVTKTSFKIDVAFGGVANKNFTINWMAVGIYLAV